MTCRCQHIALTHAYVTATRSNQGECLALGCGCRGFAERAENPLEIRGNGVSAWENGRVARAGSAPTETDPLATISTRPKGA